MLCNVPDIFIDKSGLLTGQVRTQTHNLCATSGVCLFQALFCAYSAYRTLCSILAPPKTVLFLIEVSSTVPETAGALRVLVTSANLLPSLLTSLCDCQAYFVPF